MKIASQQPQIPTSSSMLDNGLKQLEQVADRALGGFNDLSTGFGALLSSTNAKEQAQGANPTTKATEKQVGQDAQIAAGIAARTTAYAEKEITKENAKDTANNSPPTNNLVSPDALGNIQQQILSTLGLVYLLTL